MEQRPIAEQLVRGGLPAVRQAIAKQNEEAKAAGKPEISPAPLLGLAEELLPGVRSAEWRDRADAAIAQIDEVDLRDLRTVVTAADTAARDEDSRGLAAQLREGLAARADREHKEWLAELDATLADGRVVRALRLSSRPPKAGVPLPADLASAPDRRDQRVAHRRGERRPVGRGARRAHVRTGAAQGRARVAAGADTDRAARDDRPLRVAAARDRAHLRHRAATGGHGHHAGPRRPRKQAPRPEREAATAAPEAAESSDRA